MIKRILNLPKKKLSNDLGRHSIAIDFYYLPYEKDGLMDIRSFMNQGIIEDLFVCTKTKFNGDT